MTQVLQMAGFGEKLKSLRRKAGLSQEKLARAADISTSAVTKLEAGKVEPTWRTVQALARVLGVTVLEFVDDEKGEGEQAEKPKRKPRP